jgi:hypothetical protein
MLTINEINQALPAGHSAKLWEKNGKTRIYISGHKGREVLHYDVIGNEARRSAKNFGNYDQEGVFVGEDDLGASVLQAHGLKIIAAG